MSKIMRSTSRLTLALMVFAIAFVSLGSPIYAQVTVKKTGILFHTLDDDKDHDSRVLISVTDGNRVTFGTQKLDDSAGQFMDGSNHSVVVDLSSHPARKDIQKGHLLLDFRPNGHDTWRFSCTITFDWSDGTRTEQTFDTQQLKNEQKLDLVLDQLK